MRRIGKIGVDDMMAHVFLELGDVEDGVNRRCSR
jgi:hypothetical protein